MTRNLFNGVTYILGMIDFDVGTESQLMGSVRAEEQIETSAQFCHCQK